MSPPPISYLNINSSMLFFLFNFSLILILLKRSFIFLDEIVAYLLEFGLKSII